MRRFKNEQSRALPTDRFFFFYNHFHNALAVRSDSVTDRGDINQFTLGVEKTFGDGDWSVELRLPLAGESSLDNGFASARSDGVGNLAVTLRKLLYSDSEIALAAGLAVTAPTGSDADLTYFSNRVTIANDAVHLVPYLAIQAAPDDHWFFHGFAQFDVAANGDHITVTSPPISNPFVNTRRIVEQTLMYLDASVGHWWIRHTEPGTSGLTGLASVLELHYTTPLNDADLVLAGPLIVGNIDNRIDVVNLTMGLHSEWNHHTAVRFATVVPLRQSRENRFFDAEFQGTVIRRF